MTEYIMIGLLVIAVALLVTVIIKLFSGKQGAAENEIRLRAAVNDSIQTNVKNLGDMISVNQKTAAEAQIQQLGRLEDRFRSLETNSEQRLEGIRKTMDDRLNTLREENNKELEKIRGTVDEKLQKTLEDKMTQSFRLVSERLEQVYKGLGEMQSMANSVGDLKKVLSNVKTRGILGEIQLGAILSDILSPEQYSENVAVDPESKNVVEFAVKLPGENGESVWLPIDSKFPGDAYAAYRDACESCDQNAVAAAAATLEARIKSEAKDICTKYIAVPYTTNFAVMFLPFEGLYAEVINNTALVEELQKKYKVNVAGPSTMAALLNSLQMGFRTLAIQKRSAEVWNILGAVKTEFGKFEDALEKARSQITKANNELDSLVGTRTRAINRRLREVESLSEIQASELLGTDRPTE